MTCEELLADFDRIAGDRDPGGAGVRADILAHLKDVLARARQAIRAQLEDDGKGLACAQRLSVLQDAIIEALFGHASGRIYRASNPSAAERLSIVAVGGYGRGTLAPGSDIDLLFLFPYKVTPWAESVTEYVLYMLWDLGQKVGHGTRTVTECLRAAGDDMTIRTALLESRHICGDPAIFETFDTRFTKEIVARSAPEFIAAKLAERDARHRRSGATRYRVEPNVKDGKGGLRDLQTLYWLAKYSYRSKRGGEALVDAGLLTAREQRLFRKCSDFLWAVRCHLHFLAGRAEEQLTFDMQPEIANRLGYQKHPGLRAVERFMKHYFLVAKDVGDLTRIVCSALEERETKKYQGLNRFLPGLARRRRKLAGTADFIMENGRINAANPHVFERDPVNLIRIFQIAGKGNHAFHPDATRLITRSLKLIDKSVQNDPEANRLFIDILTSRRNAETVLRRMNETGVLGRFVREFGRVVAMMQFNMYHRYTVDEHLIQSIGVLADMESGRLGHDHPLSHEIIGTLKDPVVLYVALFLHDIAKGRPEDHSIAGARVARKLCPRFGLTPGQTEAVAWLVEQHLTMSIVAQSRDLSDRKTILDFAQVVESMDRMKQLLVLTVCDIRAVGPGVWNGWKGQLLRTLYYETEPMLTGGFSTVSREESVARAKSALADLLADWPARERNRVLKLHHTAYWLRVDAERQARHAELIRKADADKRSVAFDIKPMTFEAATEITVLTPDHPRLLTLIAGACSACDANIVDAQIFTTRDGRALDTIIVSRAFEEDRDEMRRGRQITALIEKALAGTVALPEAMARRRRGPSRREAFTVEPQVVFENDFSNRFTVIEVQCLDRVGLLYDLTRAMADLNLNIGSAHIATFGERVRDNFYVTDLTGGKIQASRRQSTIRKTLLAAIEGHKAAKKTVGTTRKAAKPAKAPATTPKKAPAKTRAKTGGGKPDTRGTRTMNRQPAP